MIIITETAPELREKFISTQYTPVEWILNLIIKTELVALAGYLSGLESDPMHQKNCGFGSWSGHIPRLRVQSSVGAHTEGHLSMFLFLPLSLPLSLKSIKKKNPQVRI